MLLFGAGFIAMVVACFMFAQSENSKAAEANRRAKVNSDMLDKLITTQTNFAKVVEERFKANDEAIVKFADIVASHMDDKDKLKNTVEWLKLRAENQPKHQPVQELKLTQDKPLRFTVLYKQITDRPHMSPSKDIVDATHDKIHEKVVQKIKAQMLELNQ